MLKIMEYRGVKCDRTGCGYKEDNVKSHQYLSYVNKLCPKCSANLMTKKEAESAVLTEKVWGWITLATLIILVAQSISITIKW